MTHTISNTLNLIFLLNIHEVWPRPFWGKDLVQRKIQTETSIHHRHGEEMPVHINKYIKTNTKQKHVFQAYYANRILCVSVLRVASGPRVKLASCKSALKPPVVYSTDRSKAVVPVLVLLFVAMWFILRGDLLYVLPCVILFLYFQFF